MKKLLSTLLLALITIAGWAQKEVVWENPSAFTGSGNIEFDITKMELKETETVMHFRVKFIPNYWIRFAKESFLKTPDGKEYAVGSGKKTSEAESDVELDSLFWMPESGLADLVLHFKPVPTDTKEIDFIEGYDEGAFRFFNICDKKTKKEPEWPAEWKGVKYAQDEKLPEAKIGKGVARIKVKLLGYKPGMGMELRVGGFRPLGEKEYFDKSFPLADDGTATAEIPLRMTREVSVGVSGVAGGPLVIAPGQEIALLMNIGEGNNRPLAIKGFLAKTNMDLNEAFVKLLPKDAQVIRYEALSQCDTPEKLRGVVALLRRQLYESDDDDGQSEDHQPKGVQRPAQGERQPAGALRGGEGIQLSVSGQADIAVQRQVLDAAAEPAGQGLQHKGSLAQRAADGLFYVQHRREGVGRTDGADEV